MTEALLRDIIYMVTTLQTKTIFWLYLDFLSSNKAANSLFDYAVHITPQNFASQQQTSNISTVFNYAPE